MEAAINQLFLFPELSLLRDEYLVQHGFTPQTRKVLAELWKSNIEKASILDKYATVLLALQHPPFDRGANPFQSVKCLMDLRNAVVHFKDGWRDANGAHRIEKLLKGKFNGNKFIGDSEVDYFPSHCLSAGCAKWAAESALTFADEFFDKIGVKPWHGRSKHLYTAWPETL